MPIIGSDPAFAELPRKVRVVARARIAVNQEGENRGTGGVDVGGGGKIHKRN